MSIFFKIKTIELKKCLTNAIFIIHKSAWTCILICNINSNHLSSFYLLDVLFNDGDFCIIQVIYSLVINKICSTLEYINTSIMIYKRLLRAIGIKAISCQYVQFFDFYDTSMYILISYYSPTSISLKLKQKKILNLY